MSDLRLPIKRLTFDQLVELGRAAIPPAARGWTDHNIHDPGIMLTELVAWVAEAQIYSLSRLRRDERLAYARLLDTTTRGPQPASGLIWPDPFGDRGFPSPPWAEGTLVKTDTPVSANRPNAPAFMTAHDVALTTARIALLETRFADGSPDRDWTTANARDGATFLPFGVAPARGDRLAIEFELPPAGAERFTGPLSLGFEIVSEKSEGQATRDAYPAASSAAPRRRSPLAVTMLIGDLSHPLAILEDTTNGMLRSGVLLLDIPANVLSGPRFAITLESATGGFVRSPRIQRIAPNVLRVEQRKSVGDEFADIRGGEPDQTYELKQRGLIFPLADGAFVVKVSERGGFQIWTPTTDLGQSGPIDRHFTLDEATGTLQFGNGLNGFIPATNETLSVSYPVCEGTRGNLPKNSRWTVTGISGEFGVNSAAMSGGCDAIGLTELGAAVRRRSRQPRPLVTSTDLEEAALQLPYVGVNRAREIAATPECRTVRGTRTLVVMSRRNSGESIGPEAREFLDAVRRGVAPRLPVGQRVEVVGPDYVPLRVTARLVAARKANPADVLATAIAVLNERLRLTATGDHKEWPFERNVTTASVQGWLRRVDGVIAVSKVQLLAGAEVGAVDELKLSGRQLPGLTVDPTDIVVERLPLGSAS